MEETKEKEQMVINDNGEVVEESKVMETDSTEEIEDIMEEQEETDDVEEYEEV